MGTAKDPNGNSEFLGFGRLLPGIYSGFLQDCLSSNRFNDKERKVPLDTQSDFCSLDQTFARGKMLWSRQIGSEGPGRVMLHAKNKKKPIHEVETNLEIVRVTKYDIVNLSKV